MSLLSLAGSLLPFQSLQAQRQKNTSPDLEIYLKNQAKNFLHHVDTDNNKTFSQWVRAHQDSVVTETLASWWNVQLFTNDSSEVYRDKDASVMVHAARGKLKMEAKNTELTAGDKASGAHHHLRQVSFYYSKDRESPNFLQVTNEISDKKHAVQIIKFYDRNDTYHKYRLGADDIIVHIGDTKVTCRDRIIEAGKTHNVLIQPGRKGDKEELFQENEMSDATDKIKKYITGKTPKFIVKALQGCGMGL